jgi:hypothetical protein
MYSLHVSRPTQSSKNNAKSWRLQQTTTDTKTSTTAQLKLTTASPIVTFSSIPNWITSLVVRIKVRRVWRYQRGNQIPYIEEEQTTYWPKEKVQKDKQRSTKHTYKSKDRVTRTPLKTGGEIRCSGRVNSSCSTSGNRRVNVVTNPCVICPTVTIPYSIQKIQI